jgi:hypothetical protein
MNSSWGSTSSRTTVSVDLVDCVLQLFEEEMAVWCPGAHPDSLPYANGSTEMVAGWCCVVKSRSCS